MVSVRRLTASFTQFSATVRGTDIRHEVGAAKHLLGQAARYSAVMRRLFELDVLVGRKQEATYTAGGVA